MRDLAGSQQELGKGWNHSICWDCWWDRYPASIEGGELLLTKWPVRVTSAISQQSSCCFCGNPHRSGICIRSNPSDLKHCRGHSDSEP